MGLFDALGTALAQAGQGALTGAVQGQQSQIEQGRFNQEMAFRQRELDQQLKIYQDKQLGDDIQGDERFFQNPEMLADALHTHPDLVRTWFDSANKRRAQAGLPLLPESLLGAPAASPSAASPPGGPAAVTPAGPATVALRPTPSLAQVFTGEPAFDAGSALVAALKNVAQPAPARVYGPPAPPGSVQGPFGTLMPQPGIVASGPAIPPASAPGAAPPWHPPLIGPSAAAPQPGISSATRTVSPGTAPSAPASATIQIPGYGAFTMPPSYDALRSFDYKGRVAYWQGQGYPLRTAIEATDKEREALTSAFQTELQGIDLPLKVKEAMSRIGMQDAQTKYLGAETTQLPRKYDIQQSHDAAQETYWTGMVTNGANRVRQMGALNKVKGSLIAAETTLANARERETDATRALVQAKLNQTNAQLPPAERELAKALTAKLWTYNPLTVSWEKNADAAGQLNALYQSNGQALGNVLSGQTYTPPQSAPPTGSPPPQSAPPAGSAKGGLGAGDFALIAKGIGGGMTADGVQTIYNEVLHGTYGSYKSRLPDKAHQVIADKVRQALGR